MARRRSTRPTKLGRFLDAALREVLVYSTTFVVVTGASYAMLNAIPPKELVLSPMVPAIVEQPNVSVQLDVQSQLPIGQ
jgi:hypothetical protein